MLNKAIAKAVQLKIIPKYTSMDDNVNYYKKMREVLKSALEDSHAPKQ